MKKLTLSILLLGVIAIITPLKAQSVDAHEKLKKHINSVVEKVEQAEASQQKRVILNESFDDLISTLDRVSTAKAVPESDKEALADFKKNLTEKKNELNGLNGYSKVPDSQLNNFANFVQQDLEQADTVVTISVTTALLIIIILLLL